MNELKISEYQVKDFCSKFSLLLRNQIRDILEYENDLTVNQIKQRLWVELKIYMENADVRS